MMDDLDKYIDELYRQKLSGAGVFVPTSETDWLHLGKIIRRRNFLRFHPGSFNVFYLAVSLGVIATMSIVVFPDFLENHHKNMPQPVIPITDSLSVDDTLSPKQDSAYIIKPELPKKKSDPEIQKKVKTVDEHNDLTDLKSYHVCTEENLNTTVVPEKKDNYENFSSVNDSSVEEKKSLPIVHEQPMKVDTIIKTDTIRVQKKTLKFKRKKKAF